MERMTVEFVKQTYKTGVRVELISMKDPRPIPDGQRGTVVCVDDIGTIHVQWDGGRELGLIPGEDVFKIVKDNDVDVEK